MGKIMKALNLFKRKGSKTTSRSENPGLSNLRTQSYILKENRRQGYPLGDLPSAASEISKATTKYGGQGIILKKGVPTKSVGKSIAQWQVKCYCRYHTIPIYLLLISAPYPNFFASCTSIT